MSQQIGEDNGSPAAALLMSAAAGDAEGVSRALSAGAAIEARDDGGRTVGRHRAVIPASERGHVAYVRRVVQTGIDVDHVNDLGWTALLEAVILGDGSAPYQEIVSILPAAGANPTLADRDGVTPVEHARRLGHEQLTALLTSRA